MRFASSSIAALVLAGLLGGCGFDLLIRIGAQSRSGSLELNGKPVPYVEIEESFDSIADARSTPIPFEVSAGARTYTFDLRPYVHCEDDDDPSSLDVYLLLTYSTTCLPLPEERSDTLSICWDGSRCGNVDSIPRAVPDGGEPGR